MERISISTCHVVSIWGRHRHIQSILEQAHPNIWKFLELIVFGFNNRSTLVVSYKANNQTLTCQNRISFTVSQWEKRVANLYLVKSLFTQSFLNWRPELTMDIHIWIMYWKDGHIVYHIDLVKWAGVSNSEKYTCIGAHYCSILTLDWTKYFTDG